MKDYGDPRKQCDCVECEAPADGSECACEKAGANPGMWCFECPKIEGNCMDAQVWFEDRVNACAGINPEAVPEMLKFIETVADQHGQIHWGELSNMACDVFALARKGVEE